jgi:hypothetical protein
MQGFFDHHDAAHPFPDEFADLATVIRVRGSFSLSQGHDVFDQTTDARVVVCLERSARHVPNGDVGTRGADPCGEWKEGNDDVNDAGY